MSSASTKIPGSLVWIVIPEDKVGDNTALEAWLESPVGDWVKVLEEGADTQLLIRFIALYGNKFITDDNVQETIRAAVLRKFESAKINFEETPCLKIKYPKDQDKSTCDLPVSERCGQVPRLLLVDQRGKGYPCYGYWYSNQSGDPEYPALSDSILKSAYRAKKEDRFRSLCKECKYARPTGMRDIFPCSRHGCSTKESMWHGEPFHHLQFGRGKKNNRCKKFIPVFETSLEQSRIRLEKILFKEDFWRSALIDKNYELEKFWPVLDGDAGTLIPIYGSYSFELDSATKLDQFPASNYFSQEPVGLSLDTYKKIRDAFLPVCFLPHLRVMFELVKDVCLLSVILSDRHRGSEFRYRSLYRNNEETPACFRDSRWQRLWRLPYNWSAWQDNVLNLSSAVRSDNLSSEQNIQQPLEYLAILDNSQHLGRRLTKIQLDLSVICKEFSNLIEQRASAFRSAINDCFNNTADEHKRVLLPLFFMQSNKEDNARGRKIWELVQTAKWSENLCINDPRGRWIKWSEILEKDKGDSGCRLLNYIVWVQSIFKRDVCAIEAFNSTTISDKSPSQFVVFSSRPLGTLDRSRFKLTLTTLLQPIESAYAIGTEIDKHQIELAEHIYAVGHPLKHRLGEVRGDIETEIAELQSAFDPVSALTRWEGLRIRARRAENTAQMLDLMAELCRCGGDLAQIVAAKFLTTRSYELARAITQIRAEFSKSRFDVKIPDEDLECLKGWKIIPTIPTKTERSRLYNTFYDDILYELLVNPIRRMPVKERILRIMVDDILLESDDITKLSSCLIISNPTFLNRFDHISLCPEKWLPWRTDRGGPKGGLRLIANNLRITRMGDLYAKPYQEKGKWWFSVALHLKAALCRVNVHETGGS